MNSAFYQGANERSLDHSYASNFRTTSKGKICILVRMIHLISIGARCVQDCFLTTSLCFWVWSYNMQADSETWLLPHAWCQVRSLMQQFRLLLLWKTMTIDICPLWVSLEGTNWRGKYCSNHSQQRKYRQKTCVRGHICHIGVIMLLMVRM